MAMAGITGNKSKTPQSHDESKDTNKEGHNHNYFLWQTRSGNIPLRIDDTKGNESISVEHRSGSKMSFLADGSTKFVSQYGRVDVTYGQHRSIVTGAHDATYRGQSSRRTMGDHRETNENNVESVTNGKAVVAVGESYNMTVGEGFDLAAEKVTMKAGEGLTFEGGNGPISVTGKGGVGLLSTGSSVLIGSKTDSVGIKAAATVAVQGDEVHVTGGGATLVMKGGKVYINSGSATQPETLSV
jgi:hypothetical protein